MKYITTIEAEKIHKCKLKLGNVAAHTAGRISREEAALALRNLHQFVSWIEYCYSPEYSAGEFREDILPTGDEQKVTRAELERLYAQMGTKDRKLKDVVTENEQLRAELKKAREQNEKTRRFTVETASEFQTRKHYIDLDLKDGGWIFGDDCIEEYEVEGMPFGSGKGYVDYVLFGDNGRPLAAVEAKKASKNPNEGKQQAVLYAGCLEKKFGRRPVIFYTNGFEHYLWDDAFYPPRRVSGFYSKEELQLLVDRRTDRTPLDHLRIKDEITNRYYQKEAVKAVCDSFTNKERKALLVMATGSGKTRTVISLVDILARHNWVKNTLFLADRTALVRQAKNSFNNLLLNMSLCNLLDSKDSPDSRIVFSTYPTMMNAIDETKSPDGKKLFTTGHFELVIIDESHRSIYRKYQAIFDYFDALLLVRQIVGLDQQAANGAFSEFLNDQNLDARQSRFVKTIVDYVVKNGVMTDKRVLQEDPFQGIGSITDIFTTEKAMKIVSIIDWINKNATDVIGA